MSDASSPELGRLVRRGLAWSAASNLVLRFGSLALGIALARLLTPEQFGVYAVALTVQAVLMTFADLGLSAGLIVSDDPDREAPTVATLGVLAGVVAGLGMLAVAGPLAAALGSPDSATAIRVLAFTLLLAGAGVVPYAYLQRRFAQRALFAIALVDFCVSTVVTLALVSAGWGAVSIAVGRVVAQSVALVLQFVLAGVRPRAGIEGDLVRPVLRFGLPVAATTLLSWVALNLDNVVVAKISGPVELGFYVLAFNVAMWPMTAIGQVIRSVSLPAFARDRGRKDDATVVRAVSLVGALALPSGACLAVLAVPVIHVVYGDTWAPSGPVLAALGVFGTLRVLFDLFAAYLLAHGRSGMVLWIQIGWCVASAPALVVATRMSGATGAGWAQVGVGLLVVLPAYVVALQGEGLAPRRLGTALWRPTLACVPAAAAGWWVVSHVGDPLASLGGGFLAGSLIYGVLVGPWLWRLVKTQPVADDNGDPAGVAVELGV